jgi:hypothetical protein
MEALPDEVESNRAAVAETSENNVRSKILREQRNDPAFYAKMSVLLDEIDVMRKARAVEYEEYRIDSTGRCCVYDGLESYRRIDSGSRRSP